MSLNELLKKYENNLLTHLIYISERDTELNDSELGLLDITTNVLNEIINDLKEVEYE